MRNCIILGSGRSGTSMVAGCLAQAGYFMGGQMLPARTANPKGLFEDEEINDINEQILTQVLPSGIPVYGNFFQPRSPRERPRWLACLPQGIPLTITPDIATRIQRATGHVPFCYKDPRFCYTLPVWEPFLKDTALVCVFRYPAVSAASMVRECAEVEALQPLKMSYRRALEIWYQMYSHVLQHRRADSKWLFLHYDQVVRGDHLDQLAAATGAIVDRSFPDSTLDRTRALQPVPPKHLELYREFCHLAMYQGLDGLSRATPTAIVSSPAIRPLVVAHSSQYGGAEKVLQELVKGLTAREVKPLVVFPESGRMEKAMRDVGIQTEIMEMSWCIGPADHTSEQYLRYASNLKERVYPLADLIQQRQLNVVITNTAILLEGALAARLTGVPHIWYVHEMLSRDPALTTLVPLASFNSLLEQLTDKIVVVSHAVKREIEQFVATDKIEVVYTGLDTDASTKSNNLKSRLFGWDETVPTVCFVGAHSERKGLRNLVDAAPAVVEKFPQVKFVLVGCETDYSRLVHHRIQERNLNDHFRIIGFRDDALDIIANSDILVLPSVADALPLAVLEAMHLGKPVVATLSGGAAEMVVDGATGLLVPVNNSQALAQALVALLQSPETQHRFGRQARERARELFGYESYLSNWNRVLTDVTRRRPVGDSVAPELIDGLLTLFERAASDKVTAIEQRGTIAALTHMIGSLERDREEQRERMNELKERLNRIHKHPLYKIYRWVRRRPKTGDR